MLRVGWVNEQQGQCVITCIGNEEELHDSQRIGEQRQGEIFTFSETTTESWEGANRLVRPLPPVAVRTGFDNVPSVSEI